MASLITLSSSIHWHNLIYFTLPRLLHRSCSDSCDTESRCQLLDYEKRFDSTHHEAGWWSSGILPRYDGVRWVFLHATRIWLFLCRCTYTSFLARFLVISHWASVKIPRILYHYTRLWWEWLCWDRYLQDVCTSLVFPRIWLANHHHICTSSHLKGIISIKWCIQGLVSIHRIHLQQNF